MLPFDPTELTRCGGLALAARTIVDRFLSGFHRTPFKGFNVEFAEHRQYSPGDEIQHIDWRTYGKTDRLFVKEHEEEATLGAFLVVDASGSMRYKGGQATSKFGYAQQVAASLAYLIRAQNGAVGLAVHDTKVRQLVPAKTGSKHLLGLLRGLETAVPGGEAALAQIWHELAVRHLKRRGLVVLISDCFDQPHHLAQALRHLRQHRHEVFLFHVLAPEEIEFPFDRPTRFRDLERIGEDVRGDALWMRQEYRRNFEDYQTALVRAARDLRVEYHPLLTDEPVDRALGAYLAMRK